MTAAPEMTSVPVIHAEGLTRNYQMGASTLTVLNGISLDIHSGEFVALMGSSGSGKSTLLNLLGCLDRPSGGRYELAGQDISVLNASGLAELRGRQIGFIFQNFNLLPRLNAWENVALPLVYLSRSIPLVEQKELAEAALDRVGLTYRSGHLPQELSGGERQRVAIARALVNQPAVLLADEPTGNLDRRTGLEIMELLREFHQSGRTILMVTHDPAIAASAARICTMQDGCLVKEEVGNGKH
jgi:putative ABC transport system ATP-binding protein